MRLGEESLEYGERAVIGMDALVMRDVVAIVPAR
jgi:hypothetical protein